MNPLWISFTCSLFFGILLGQIYEQVGFPVGVFASQLSFSATAMMEHFEVLRLNQTLNLYRWTIIIDYGFLISCGFFNYFWGRNLFHRNQPGMAKILSLLIFTLVPFGFFLDAIENTVLLFILNSPSKITQSQAILYSGLALAKWLTISITLASPYCFLKKYRTENRDSINPYS